jgi:hypothetical protein
MLIFRRDLRVRLRNAALLSLPLAAMTLNTGACDGPGAADGSGMVEKECIRFDAGMPTGASGTGGGSATDGGAGVCPSGDDVASSLERCNEVLTDGTLEDGQCCYEVRVVQCAITGRPFLVEGRARTAAPRAIESGAWRAGSERARVDGLRADVRARLAAEWASDGLFEHASIASFGRFALELLAVGAPADLVADAHRAALDEVNHARICFSLASAFAGKTSGPSPFPFEGRVEVSADLESIAARAVREGCIGETIGALFAAEQLALSEDPAVRAALAVIVEDESRHAELAFRFVAWAIASGGALVEAAVARAFVEPVTLPDGGQQGEFAAEMAAHGRLDPARREAILRSALREVVWPCANSLLATPA